MDLKAVRYGQVSADPNAQKNSSYRKVIGKSGKAWFYVPGPFAADAIYVDGGKGSKGMGGRTITFHLKDGTTFNSIGPWMTTANNMYSDTGVDLRNQYSSRLVLARGVHYPEDGHHYAVPEMLDVVFHEEKPVEGKFERARELAKKIVNEMNESLYYFIETNGGSQQGLMKPEEG